MLGRYNAREHMTLASTAMANLQSSWQVAGGSVSNSLESLCLTCH